MVRVSSSLNHDWGPAMAPPGLHHRLHHGLSGIVGVGALWRASLRMEIPRVTGPGKIGCGCTVALWQCGCTVALWMHSGCTVALWMHSGAMDAQWRYDSVDAQWCYGSVDAQWRYGNYEVALWMHSGAMATQYSGPRCWGQEVGPGQGCGCRAGVNLG